MNRGILLTVGLLSFLLGSCSRLTSPPSTAEQPESKFRPGQVWAFKTPPNQPNAKLTVLRVERDEKVGTIVHIRLSGVSYGNGQTVIPHLPFAESAVDQSVTTLERESGSVPDYAEGYRLWREAFDSDKGGVFSITVADAYEAVTSIAKGQE